jgi:hypothetical protein
VQQATPVVEDPPDDGLARHGDDPRDRVVTLTVTVLGVPVPQGAIRSLGTGRPSVHANAKALHPWRQMVAQQVRWQMGDAGLTEPWTGR